MNDADDGIVNPFNLASIPGAAPPRGFQDPRLVQQQRGVGGQWTLSQYPARTDAGRSLIGKLRADQALLLQPGASAEEMQKEYVRQRGMVMAELRRAKEDAEEERRKIMLKINSVLSSAAAGGQWRR